MVFASGFPVAFVSDNFSVAPAEILDSNIRLVIVHSILFISHWSVEYTPGIHDQGKMLVLPNQLLYRVLSTSD